MGYCTSEDILLEISSADLARLTGDASGQTINYTKIDYAIGNADAVINSFLYGRYPIPFQDVIDPVIRKLSLDLTIANLYEYAYAKTIMPQTIVYRRLNALRMLKDVQAGFVSLLDANLGTQPPPLISNKTAEDRLFTEELLNEFIDL